MAYVEDTDILQKEFSSSKRQIEEHLGEPVIHFSYPSPMLEPHLSERTIGACMQAGYLTATTIVTLLFPVILVLILQRFLIEGLTKGAVKE
jgi:hypothetical protein